MAEDSSPRTTPSVRESKKAILIPSAEGQRRMPTGIKLHRLGEARQALADRAMKRATKATGVTLKPGRKSHRTAAKKKKR